MLILQPSLMAVQRTFMVEQEGDMLLHSDSLIKADVAMKSQKEPNAYWLYLLLKT